MQPTTGLNCGQYLKPYMATAGGAVYNPNAMSDCQFCALTSTDEYLGQVAISYSTRWRNYGIVFAYIIFNISMAVVFYYMFRVRKGSGRSIAERLSPLLKLFKSDPEKENVGSEKKKAPQAKGE
jgi:ATP-binding cassette subfamily G (WHITE) protein 2 (PDR)